MGLSLKVDTSASTFYRPGWFLDFVHEHLTIRDMRSFDKDDRVKLKKALRGVTVEVTHRQGSWRYYKITNITSLPMNELMWI